MEKEVDTIFLVDCSGSMREYLVGIKKELTEFCVRNAKEVSIYGYSENTFLLKAVNDSNFGLTCGKGGSNTYGALAEIIEKYKHQRPGWELILITNSYPTDFVSPLFLKKEILKSAVNLKIICLENSHINTFEYLADSYLTIDKLENLNCILGSLVDTR